MTRTFLSVLAILAAQSATAQEATTVDVSESDEYGQFLTVDGKPVYLFSTDTQGSPGMEPVISCIGECLDAWPLVTSAGTPEAGEEADPAMLGTVDHEGETIVTYNGWPLYHFMRDAEDGPPTGQEIESFGGGWYLVGPDGDRIEGEGA
jgi:predicted lipoprotein with Yx(FWY)xxD motif